MTEKLPQNVANMVVNTLQAVKIHTKGDDTATEATITRSVVQGSALCPTLFNIYMDTLVREFDDGYRQVEQTNPTIKQEQVIALFAGDIKLQAAGTNELQKGLDRATKWATEHEMT